MSQTGNARWLTVAVIASACLLLAPVGASAQKYPDTFWVNYFSNNVPGNPGGWDQEVRIVNPGVDADNYPPASLCAMIYVFDKDQEMRECCGCYISTNGLAELSVANDLTSNTFTGGAPRDGNIKIISAPSNINIGGAPACDPTGGGVDAKGGYILNIAPTPDLRAWSTHLPGYRTRNGHLTEDEFQDATLSTGELDSLQEECTGVLAVGSGYGQCGQHANNSSFYCTL